jgi:hypothetical protein
MLQQKQTMTTELPHAPIFDPHRPIGDITGEFFVPAYQRGYRWTVDDVTRLLDDIEHSLHQHKDKPYTLQPIVVRRRSSESVVGSNQQWELIDGQQRLTTIYLIFLVMRDNGWKKNLARYSLIYETHEAEERWHDFKSDVLPRAEENIDFFHLAQAYRTIEQWFSYKNHQRLDDYQQEERANNLFSYLNRFVKVIWYEPLTAPNLNPEQAEQEAIALFTRLNVGRIPLTDAELVKALLLNAIKQSNEDRAYEIAAQWDGIERDLQRDDVWSFISGIAPSSAAVLYPTRISLLLETLADRGNPPPFRRARYQTFETLRNEIEQAPITFWYRVIELHAQILGWMEDEIWYNKIGFLITTGHKRFSDILNASNNQRKSTFDLWLTSEIRQSLKLTTNKLSELSYENANDKERLLNVLLLFNVETSTRSGQRFPFTEHVGEIWSLEHIHAQHSEGMNKEEQWRKWLHVQSNALAALALDFTSNDQKIQCEQVIQLISHELKQQTLDGETFKKLYAVTIPFFGSGETDHSIRNLALLSCRDNSELNNAVFEAKRQIILEHDRNGHYIPVCTRHVFFKYYAKAGHEQLHFWDDKDKEAYFDSITSVEKGIGNYLLPDQSFTGSAA